MATNGREETRYEIRYGRAAGARGAKLRDPEFSNLPSLIQIGLSEVLGKVRQPGLKGILCHARAWLVGESFLSQASELVSQKCLIMIAPPPMVMKKRQRRGCVMSK